MRFITVIICAFVFTNCVSSNTSTGQPIFDSVESTGRLSEQNRQLTEQLEQQQAAYQQFRDAIGAAEEAAADAALDIRGAISILKEYKQRVDEYIKRVDSLSTKVEGND